MCQTLCYTLGIQCWKNKTEIPAFMGQLAQRGTQSLNSLMDSVGEGEGGKIWENGIETCIISCMKRVSSPGSMHDTGCLGLVHWDDPEGGYAEGGGFRMGNTCIPVVNSC